MKNVFDLYLAIVKVGWQLKDVSARNLAWHPDRCLVLDWDCMRRGKCSRVDFRKVVRRFHGDLLEYMPGDVRVRLQKIMDAASSWLDDG